MIICAKRFNRADPMNPQTSMVEIDIYAWIPVDRRNEARNHRLTLRKNLRTDCFEAIRIIPDPPRDNLVELAFQSPNLARMLLFINTEWARFHGSGREEDVACWHHPGPQRAFDCASMTGTEPSKCEGCGSENDVQTCYLESPEENFRIDLCVKCRRWEQLFTRVVPVKGA